jgi:CBS domain-containing protein
MKVKDILHGKGTAVATIPADATLHDALKLLVKLRIGSLVVTDGHNPLVGIITERDLLQECAAHTDGLRKMTVREIMRTNPIIGVPEDEVAYVMGIMTHNRIRHLPILEGERLAGLISIGDVVKAQLEAVEFENRYLRDYIQHG